MVRNYQIGKKVVLYEHLQATVYSHLDVFFNGVIHSLSKARLTYEDFIIIGDFNIDVNTTGVEVDKLDVFCDLFDLTNLIKIETCCTKSQKSTIDLFLTKKSLSFQKARPTETGISDYHKLISTFLKFRYTRLKSKIIYHRNYKNFNEELFVGDLENSKLEVISEVNSVSSRHFLKSYKSMPQ